MTIEDYWEERFRGIGALWEHDGNPQRPYALLTTPVPDGRRRMTNKYFNSAVVQEHAKVFGEACVDLAQLGTPYDTSYGLRYTRYIVGAAEGGIALSQRIAEALAMRSAYAVKIGKRLVFERFSFK